MESTTPTHNLMKTILTLLACILTGSLCAQSILTTSPETPAEGRARRATENAQGVVRSVIGALRHAITDLWSTDYAANLATVQAMGPQKTAELFSIYSQFISENRALLVAAGDTAAVAEIDALAAKVPAHTVDPLTGAVTLTEPTPEP